MKLRPGLIALLCFPAACLGAYKPCVIEGQTVRNPTMGFHGFSINFPAGYALYHPDPAAKSSYGQSTWRMANDYDAAPGLHTNEIVVFEREQRMALALGLAVVVMNDAYADLSNFERTAVLTRESNFLKFSTGQVLLRTTAQIGDHLVAKVIRSYTQGTNTYINAVYIAFGDLKDRYTLNGICALADKELLLHDMESVMASLVTRKAAKK